MSTLDFFFFFVSEESVFGYFLILISTLSNAVSLIFKGSENCFQYSPAQQFLSPLLFHPLPFLPLPSPSPPLSSLFSYPLFSSHPSHE